MCRIFHLPIWPKRLVIVFLIKNEVKCESLTFLPLWQPLHSNNLSIRIHILVGFQVQVMLPISLPLPKGSHTSKSGATRYLTFPILSRVAFVVSSGSVGDTRNTSPLGNRTAVDRPPILNKLNRRNGLENVQIESATCRT